MKPEALAKARILVTNDDGIHAPGLEAMIEIARQLSSDVWVVAPEVNQSGAGHSLSIHKPLRSREVGEKKFAIEGTPTDCVLFAVKHLLKAHKPQLVLSGVNRGTNMADDVTYSGTIAGAMEGCLLGLPSIAFSQAIGYDHPIKWSTASAFGTGVARRVLTMDLPHNVFVNVNFPDVAASAVKGIKVTRQGVRAFGSSIIERIDPRGGAYYWNAFTPGDHEADEDGDVSAIRAGYVSVTPLHLDLTHEATRRRLTAQFEAAPFEAD
jgi:5'-nucleotidase